MPIVTYIGRSHMRRATDPKMPDWEQNRPVEVTTAWVDRYAPRLDELNFRIEGWTATEAVKTLVMMVYLMRNGPVRIFKAGWLLMISNLRVMQPSPHYSNSSQLL